jgi:hypothetical protein
MRRTALLLVPLFLVACDRDPVAPEPDALPTVSADKFLQSAEHIIKENFFFPWVEQRYVPCTGEWVQLEGTGHFIFTWTSMPNAESWPETRYAYHWHSQPQGVKAVGLTSGLTYKWVGHWASSGSGEWDGVPQVGHGETRFMLVAPGKGSNTLWRDRYKLVINTPGDVVVEFEEHSVECR